MGPFWGSILGGFGGRFGGRQWSKICIFDVLFELFVDLVFVEFWFHFGFHFEIFSELFSHLLNSNYGFVLQFAVFRGHRPSGIDLERCSARDLIFGQLFVVLGSVLGSKKALKRSILS